MTNATPLTIESAYASGYQEGVRAALAVVDRMRGPGAGNFSTPLLLAVRTQLLDLYNSLPASNAAA